MIDVLEQRIRKAYKHHECCYCGETIEKGETYDWSKQICDGTFYEWFSHMSCENEKHVKMHGFENCKKWEGKDDEECSKSLST